MVKITNEILYEKLLNVETTLKDIKEDTKLNTEFRLQAKGILGAFTFIAGAIGGIIVWLLNKIWK